VLRSSPRHDGNRYSEEAIIGKGIAVLAVRQRYAKEIPGSHGLISFERRLFYSLSLKSSSTGIAAGAFYILKDDL